VDDFDLVERPWIPVLRHDGSLDHAGIREALIHAAEYREIYDPSPLVTVALHRFLLAVLHRALVGPTRAEWRSLWTAGAFDASRIASYLNRYPDGFRLFDQRRPFMQTTEGWDGARVAPPARIATELSTGNNATLFDHHHDDDPASIAADEAARRLVTTQAFAIGGGVSTPFNLSHGPLVAGYCVLAAGDSLFETLALNLMPYDDQRPMPWGNWRDAPVWEGGPGPAPAREGTQPDGWASYLAWQSRAIQLERDGLTGLVTGVRIRQQMKPADGIRDPFKAYRRSAEAGMIPLRFSPERALWRDSALLFLQATDESARPVLMDWLAEIDEWREDGRIDARPVYELRAYGLNADKASVKLWRAETLPLPLALLDDPAAAAVVGDAVALAERAGKTLHGASRVLAARLLAPGSTEEHGRDPDPKDVARLARSLGIEARFWPDLERPFAGWLQTFAGGAPGDLDAWRQTVRAAADTAFLAGVDSLAPSGRTLRAVAEAGDAFRRMLGKALAAGESREENGGRAA
jgi:CRISPR system Cascade subunit CasA